MQNVKNIQDAEDKNRDNGVNKIPQSIRKTRQQKQDLLRPKSI